MITFKSKAAQIQLRSPQIGDEEVISAPKVIRKAIDGTNIAYKNGRPRQVFNLSFGNVNRNTILRFIAFVEASKNLEITYIDYNNRPFKGRILTDPSEFSHVGHSNNTFRVSFEVSNFGNVQ